MQYEYYYSELSIVEKRIYRLLYDAIKEYKQKISFGYVLNLCLDRIIRAVEYDHPELYYWNCHKVQYVSSTVQITVLLKYYLTYAEVLQNASKIEKGVKSILSKCKNKDASESERFTSIYDCMARNIRYDFAGVNTNKDDNMLTAHTIYGVFAKQKAVCDGISKAFKYVLERAGMDCIVVFGKKADQGMPHAWNIVWIDDKPCHVDLTWAIENSNVQKINYDYVGLTDKQIKKDHNIDNSLGTPKCNHEKYDYYIRNNAAMKNVKELQLYLQKHASKKPFEVNVRLDFPCKIEEIAKRAVDYIVEHYVVNGQHIKVDVQYREGQNTLLIIGK